LDHAAFRNRLNAENAVSSKSSRARFVRETGFNFSRRAPAECD
jgi:hypothetical protein